ncbi:hypothetical protein ACFX10_038434 [Malus domestica]
MRKSQRLFPLLARFTGCPRFVIDLTSSKGKKDEAARSVLVTCLTPKVDSSITNKIVHRISFVVPLVPKFVPKRPSRAKFGSPLERPATLKSDKVPLPAKVALKLVPSAVETGSSAEKKDATRAGNCEKSTKFVSREAAKIYTLLRPDLLEDMNVCARFVNGIKGVVGPSSFAKHTTEYMKTTLLAIM